jgi:hypothetical protein
LIRDQSSMLEYFLEVDVSEVEVSEVHFRNSLVCIFAQYKVPLRNGVV